MSPIAKLAGFAIGLVLVSAAAAFAGTLADVDPGRGSASAGAGAAMAEMDGAKPERAADAVRGLAVSADGLTLALERSTAPAGRRFALRFRVLDRGGRPVRRFDVEHTKRMHLIVVRRDMTGFQHVHPTMQADGTWTTPVTLAEPGSYRVFADFAHDGENQTLAGDLNVDGPADWQALPRPADFARTGDGYDVRLIGGGSTAGSERELAFSVTRGGSPVDVEEYLGADGHLVALREGDLAFLHVHPMEREAGSGTIRFMTEFPNAGSYRLFLQFKHEGRVHTAAFTREVSDANS